MSTAFDSQVEILPGAQRALRTRGEGGRLLGKAFAWMCFLLFPFCMTACDDGKIYPDAPPTASRGVNASFRFTGTAGFPESEYYQLVLASWRTGETHPISFKKITEKPAEGSTVEVSLTNLSDETNYVSLALIDKGKKLIYTFYEYSVAGLGNEIVTLPAEDIYLLSFSRLQAQLFSTKCLACHGGSAFKAAGLDLTPGHSHASLTNVSSTTHPGVLRAKPGDVRNSLIATVMHERNIVRTDHTEMVNADDIALLEGWIAGGCASD